MSDPQVGTRKYRYRPGPELLGDCARTRRETLRLTQEEVAEKFGGPSVASLRTIENAQAAGYRPRTLAALDSSLAWPAGTALLMLTGDARNITGNSGEFEHQKKAIDQLRVMATGHATPSTFDKYVEMVNAVTDEERALFGLRESGFKMLTGANRREIAVNEGHIPGANTEVAHMKQLLQRALDTFQPYMDLLDATQTGLDKVRINAEVLARIAQHENLPPAVQGAIDDLRATVNDYTKIQMSPSGWVRLAREMAAAGGDIEKAIEEIEESIVRGRNAEH